jgi:hypothetical protein
MKRIIILILIILPVFAISQNQKLKKVVNDYKDNPSFSYTNVDSNSDLDLGLDSNIEEMLNNVKKIHILNFDEGNSTKVLKNFNERINKAISNENYETLMEISSDGLFRILVKKDKDGSPVEVIIVNTGEDDSMLIWATS